MIYVKFGRLLGSLSQHRFISFAHASGVFLGIVGRSYLWSTSSETLAPEMLRYGGSREVIYHMMIEKLKISAFSVYGLFPITSGAIHW